MIKLMLEIPGLCSRQSRSNLDRALRLPLVRFVRHVLRCGDAISEASAAVEETEDHERDEGCDPEAGAESGFACCREARGGG